jgi:hypothetical protein
VLDERKMDKKTLRDNEDFIRYLERINFQKHLNKLAKKLKDKTIIIYGAGAFFNALNEKYDLSVLNIIAIADRKFINHEPELQYAGYKACAPDEITSLKPDYVLVSMLYFVSVIEDLEETCLRSSKIKIKPLINKPFVEVWKEIWS